MVVLRHYLPYGYYHLFLPVSMYLQEAIYIQLRFIIHQQERLKVGRYLIKRITLWYKMLNVGLQNVHVIIGDRGSTVVKLLRYKSEGRWLDPSWCHWNFSLT